MSRKPRTVTHFWIATVLVFEMTFSPLASSAALASSQKACESLFSKSLVEYVTPLEFRAKFLLLPPKVRERIEKRFERRESLSAENEAAQIVAQVLVNDSASTIKLRPLLSRAPRDRSIRDVLISRLRDEDARIQLEQVLLEIGYGEGSPLAQQWTQFRGRHANKLPIIAKFAKNAASSALLGVPIFLRSTPFRNFTLPKNRRSDWLGLRQEFERKIDQRDPALLRSVKIEAALEVATRIAAFMILAMITDEILEMMSPKWRFIKLKVVNAMTFGHLGLESKTQLENIAYANWKDVIEAFTGSRPDDDSAAAIEILERIRASSRDDLWLHIYRQAPLTEPVEPNDLGPSPRLTEEADQMFLGPDLGL